MNIVPKNSKPEEVTLDKVQKNKWYKMIDSHRELYFPIDEGFFCFDHKGTGFHRWNSFPYVAVVPFTGSVSFEVEGGLAQ